MPVFPPSPDDEPTRKGRAWHPAVHWPLKAIGWTSRQAVRTALWGMLVLLIMVTVAWSVLLLRILPRADEWRADIARQATLALGLKVEIARVQGHADGIWPTITLDDVRLLDPQGRVALRLPAVEARLSLTTLSPQALLDGELRLDRLVLMHPELDVRRDREGVIHVAGLAIKPGVGGSGGGADWVMSQSQIQIRGGTVRWSDDFLGAPTLALSQVEFDLSNRPSWRGRRHELTLSATPPAFFGDRVTVHASMTQPLWLLAHEATPGAPASPRPPRPAHAGLWPSWGLDSTRPAEWQTWSGTVQATFPRVDVQRLRQHVPLPIEVMSGRGALDATLQLRQGRATGLSVQADVQQVQVRLAPGLAPMAFQRLQGELSVRNEPREAGLSYRDLSFILADGVSWPASTGKLTWRHPAWPGGWPSGQWDATEGGTASADRLDLALLSTLADRLPLSTEVRAQLAELAPRGVVEQLSWSWDGAVAAPSRYRFGGRVKGLALSESEADGRPGLAGADVEVSADETGGRAELKLQKGWLAFPGVFEEPRLAMDSLSARIDWRIEPSAVAGQAPKWSVDVKDGRFANEDTSGQLQASWRTGDQPAHRLPGVLRLQGQLKKADATRVWRYLPMSLGAAPRDYVRLAVRGGHGEDVRFEVDGDLDQFPFKDDEGGRFRVKVPLRDVSLDYVPRSLAGHAEGADAVHWPPFTALYGDLIFEGQRMLIRQARGRLGTIGGGAFALTHVDGRIDDLGHPDPVLQISGQGEGPLQDALTFLARSPLSTRLGTVLTKAQAQGLSALQLGLDIPLNRSIDTRLRGEVVIKDKDRASLKLGGNVPTMQALRGRFTFTESLLAVSARTKVWGQDMAVEGQRQADGALRFVASGTMTAEALRQADDYPILTRLAPRLSGESPVTVNVTMGATDAHGKPSSLPEVQVLSSLRGISANLPAPLRKTAQANWPLKVSYRLEDDAGDHDAILVDIGNPQVTQMTSASMPWLRVDLRRDARGESAKVLRGAMSLIQAGVSGSTAVQSLPGKGVAAQIVTSALDVDAWMDVASAWSDTPTGPTRGGRAATPASAGAHDGNGAEDSYMPDTLVVQTPSLSWRQRTLKDVSATIAHPSPGVWRASLESPQAAGQIEWLPERAPVAGQTASNRVVARLTRLQVPASEAQALESQQVTQLLSADPTLNLPALDIVVEKLEWRGLDLGRVEVEAVNRQVTTPGSPPSPEWRLNRLRLNLPEAQLDASGNWTTLSTPAVLRRPGAARARSRTALNFTLDLHNGGNLLNRMGMQQVLRGSKGKLTGQVAWTGSPFEPDLSSLSGDVKVQINDGQFLKADPGIAKLLGVLSLQALPRRLALDFRDIFQQGFAFDSIDGDVKVTRGIATTQNLRMRGVQALVLMEGQADLIKETQNLHVFVVPELNAGTASLAYAAINPVVGLGTFLAQMLLRKQMAEVITREFWVTGSWADPQVEKGSGPRLEADPAVNPDAPEPASTPPKPRRPS